MRIARLALASAALTLAVAGCTTTVDGVAICPGCGTVDEPQFPTPRPSIERPTTTSAPSSTSPESTPAEPPTPIGEVLMPDASGYVFITTASGQTRCQLNTSSVACEAPFESSPTVEGGQANGVFVSPDGTLGWVLGNLGDIPVITLDYRTYSAVGWTIEAATDGTRFTNVATGHGMFVAIEGVQSF